MAKGGKTKLDNLQLLTRWENVIKGTKSQEEFMKEIQNYDYSNSKEISNIEVLEDILCNAFDHDEDLDNARALVKRILLEDENNLVALNVQGRIALIDGKYRSAIINANKVLAENRLDEFALWTKGASYYEKENYKEAIKFLEVYNKLDPSFEGNNLLGNCYLRLKKRDIALGYFDKALQMDFHDKLVLSDLHFNIGDIFFNKRKYENAFNHYSEAFKLDSSNAFAINNAGVCLERQGKLKEALEKYKIAYNINSAEGLFKSNIDKIKEKIKG